MFLSYDLRLPKMSELIFAQICPENVEFGPDLLVKLPKR